jgi:thiamine-monophosphate kinase
MVRRSTAKAGDHILVSGTIGDAALGVLIRRDTALAQRWRLNSTMRDRLLQRYLLPQPRTLLADGVLRHASASMDVSDGLAGDLAKLCRASGVAAEVDVARVPLSEAVHAVVAAEPALVETALSGGDDYEILCTMAPDNLASFQAAARTAGISVTEIGRVVGGEGARFVLDGKPLHFARPAFSHF